MITYKVNVLERFPSPFFWKNIQGKVFVLEPFEREILGKKITIENDPKTKVIIRGSWDLKANDYNSYLENEQIIKIRSEIKTAAWYAKNIKYRSNSYKFNTSLNIPVKWSPEIKQNLSGLSADSSGDAFKKNTVFHIYLHENLDSGRLKRNSKDYLCTQVSAKWGGNWSGTVGAQTENYKVTCKSCLKIANRFKN